MLHDLRTIDEISPWYSLFKPKPIYASEDVIAHWDVSVFAEHQEVKSNRVDAQIINSKTKQVIILEMTVPWVSNRQKTDEEKTLKYGPLRWELKQQYPGHEIHQYNTIFDALGGWSQELEVTMYKLVGSRSSEVLRKMQKAVLSGMLNIAKTFKVTT